MSAAESVIGRHAAVGLTTGKCHVGEIIAFDDEWIVLTLKDWITGTYCGYDILIPVKDIELITLAEPARDGEVFDEHLAQFQTEWTKEKTEA